MKKKNLPYPTGWNIILNFQPEFLSPVIITMIDILGWTTVVGLFPGLYQPDASSVSPTLM